MKEKYSHHILYAKGWYKRTDVFADLQVIQGRYSGVDPKHITRASIIYALADILFKYYKIHTVHHLLEFMNWFKYERLDAIFIMAQMQDRMICHFLNMISVLQVKDVHEDGSVTVLIDLADPDPGLLPLDDEEVME